MELIGIKMTKLSLIPYIRHWLNDGNGVIWSDSTLILLLGQAETDISGDLKCLWRRFIINTQVGVGLYPMPIDAMGITRITYRAFKVDTLNQLQLSLLSPVYRVQQSRPRWASQQFEHMYGLRFYPIPAEKLAPNLQKGNLFNTFQFNAQQFNVLNTIYNLDADLINQLVVAIHYITDQNSTVITLPNYFARRLIRLHVLKRAFAQEGPGQNLNISNYYTKRYERLLEETRSVMSRVFANVEKQYSDVAIQRPWKKHHPILPPNFGTPVNM